jgi:dihydrofolate reductase
VRKIVAGLFSTLDGVIEAPEKWNPPYYDDELNRAMMPLLADAGTHLYGRRSYELFRAVFTGPAAPPHAGLMTAAEKAVVTSRPLGDPGWGPTTVITGDVAAAITTLKRQPGGNIAVGASGTLVRFLLQAGPARRAGLVRPPGRRGRGPAPVRRRRRPGAAHAAGVPGPPQRRRRAPVLRPGLMTR